MTFFSRLACIVAAAAIYAPIALSHLTAAAPMFA